MDRASHYTICVDLDEGGRGDDGEVLLVHALSGAYDVVSRPVADYVRQRRSGEPAPPLHGAWRSEAVPAAPVPPPSDATLATLRERGHLTDMSAEDEAALFETMAATLHRVARRRVQYIFMPTYDCNLRCGYCFQAHMRTDPAFRPKLRAMTPELVDRIFAAMPGIEAMHGAVPGDGPPPGIGFFGGEPLLARNRPIVDHILDRLAQRGGGRVWAVTNATELDAYWDLIHPGGISELQITLDGPPRMHDRRRIRADGGGTFERIAAAITRGLDQGAAVSVRINIDRVNIDELPELAREIVARGWPASPGFGAYAAPITASDPKADTSLLLSSWELNRALAGLRAAHPEIAAIGTPDDTLRADVRRIFGGAAEDDPIGFQQASFCGAHTGMYIFDALGDVYACWERTGDPRIRIGQVTEDGTVALNDTFHLKWRARTVAASTACRRCRYALYCGGGCAVLAEARNGGFFTNHCDGYAQRFRAAVAQAYREHEAGAPAQRARQPVCDL